MDVEIYGDTGHLSGRFIKKRSSGNLPCFGFNGRKSPEVPHLVRADGQYITLATVQEDGHWKALHARSHPDPMNTYGAAIVLFHSPSPMNRRQKFQGA
jgi:hypothetical protein